VVNLLVFGLAFFLDFFEIAFIVVPLLAPVAAKLGIDPIWFGVLLGINMQTSFLHPPFGFALFYLRSVAPKSIRTADIYWGAVPFVLLQVLMVVIVIVFPQIVGHAPIVPESAIMEVPLEVDPDAGFLPPEWR
jgi:TRAP-type mannitol/chloroaromatic compound transport system permease large subunit